MIDFRICDDCHCSQHCMVEGRCLKPLVPASGSPLRRHIEKMIGHTQDGIQEAKRIGDDLTRMFCMGQRSALTGLLAHFKKHPEFEDEGND